MLLRSRYPLWKDCASDQKQLRIFGITIDNPEPRGISSIRQPPKVPVIQLKISQKALFSQPTPYAPKRRYRNHRYHHAAAAAAIRPLFHLSAGAENRHTASWDYFLKIQRECNDFRPALKCRYYRPACRQV